MIKLKTPISKEAILALKVGDEVLLSGTIITGRDTAHKYLTESFIKGAPSAADNEFLAKAGPVLEGGVIYHCGPVVKQENGKWSFVAAGPTTSAREEPYQAGVIKRFGLRGVIGKGGMGPKTLQGLQDGPAVYFHAVGGAASLIAQSLGEVKDVLKLEFGQPEAFWIVEAKDFPLVVSMDAHGNSLHAAVEENSKKNFEALLAEI